MHQFILLKLRKLKVFKRLSHQYVMRSESCSQTDSDWVWLEAITLMVPRVVFRCSELSSMGRCRWTVTFETVTLTTDSRVTLSWALLTSRKYSRWMSAWRGGLQDGIRGDFYRTRYRMPSGQHANWIIISSFHFFAGDTKVCRESMIMSGLVIV